MGLNGWLENDIGARRRTWLRGHMPAWAGRFFPKVENCRAHFWYAASRTELHCYHCEQTKPYDGKVTKRAVRHVYSDSEKQVALAALAIKNRAPTLPSTLEFLEAIRQDKRMADRDES